MISYLGPVPRVTDRVRSLSWLGPSNAVTVHGLSKLQEIILVIRRSPGPGCWLPRKSSLHPVSSHCWLLAVPPVVRPDGGVCGVFDDNPRVVTDPVLSPVLIPSIVHSEPAPVPGVGLVLPTNYRDAVFWKLGVVFLYRVLSIVLIWIQSMTTTSLKFCIRILKLGRWISSSFL